MLGVLLSDVAFEFVARMNIYKYKVIETDRAGMGMADVEVLEVY